MSPSFVQATDGRRHECGSRRGHSHRCAARTSSWAFGEAGLERRLPPSQLVVTIIVKVSESWKALPHFPSLTRYAWLSIAAAIATILLKGVPWWLTGSVGLLSDAIESFVNLAGALMALWMLTLSARPADDNHAYGYSKAEYFSSAFEGFLILLAAVSIGYTAIVRLMNPESLEAVGVGLLVSVVASVINFATARILLTVGREHNSITLEADAHHLMTDVWTSVGVIAGVGLVWLTGWLWLDPVLALLVAANIVWTGLQLMRRSAAGLMDVSLPVEKLEEIEALLAGYRQQGLDFHALRTRQSGSRTFVVLHVLVPGNWTLAALEANNQVLFRDCDNPNGSIRDIAGICNPGRNVFGMMPHPERATSPALGNIDGRKVFEILGLN